MHVCAGAVVADRFELVEPVGEGGMGTVWRAIDRRQGDTTVALKLLHVARDRLSQFFREAAVLAELEHPVIVRYVDHGVAPLHGPYLAMEWLEGEALDARLKRQGPVSPAEAIALARRVLPALAAAHHRGIVHRDLKPANLFLPERDLARTKLLDFGVAKRMFDGPKNRPGTTAGTPFYMSPEQARGQYDIDGRSDIFSLGSVLYECLAGTPPFRGESIVAVLAKVCVADPPRLRELVPEASHALEALLDRMLAKRAGDRPADVEELDAAFARLQGDGVRSDSITLARLSAGEQRVMCVLMASPAGTPALAADAATAELPVAGAATADPRGVAEVASALAELGGRLHALVDGSWVVAVGEHGAPIDQATRAARCGLALRRLAPSMACAISMGRAVVVNRLPLGPMIDRCIDRLRDAAAATIALDEDAATLLERRFGVRASASGELALDGELTSDAERAPERRAPFVGRVHEVAALHAAFDGAAEEDRARVVLVEAGPGTGKSRLRAEFLEGLARNGRRYTLLAADGDPLRAGVPYGLVASAFRAALGVPAAGSPEERRATVAAWTRARLAGDEAKRVAALLGELVGAPFPDDAHPVLKAARQDPRLLAEQIALAAADAIRAECRARPVLLVLDDLQWADATSVALVDVLLREAADAPVLVLGLARPGLEERHPRLWDGRPIHRLTLPPLSKKASRELAMALLGPEHELLGGAIADKADGNPLFVEELARVAHRRGTTELPDAVLGTIQARLDDLSAAARKLLRAASIFGASFSRDALTALIGPDEATVMAASLDELAREDLIVVPRDDRPLTFRHTLIREAAYETLTDGDRFLGHRMAARWLESTGRADPAVLVEHHERGGDRPRAILWSGRTAREALARGDLEGAAAYARRGAELGATGGELGGLRLVEANALRSKGDVAASAAAAARAMDVLPKGSADWFHAAECAAHVLGDSGDGDGLERLAAALSATTVPPEAAEPKLGALAAVGCGLIATKGIAGRPIVELALADATDALSPTLRARLAYAGARLALCDGRLGATVAHCREALAQARAADNELLVVEMRGSLAAYAMEVGGYDEAEALFRENLAFAARVRSPVLEAIAVANFGTIASVRGRHAEALAHAERATRLFASLGARYLEAASRVIDAHIALAAGDSARARGSLEAYAAVEQHAPGYRPWATAVAAQLASRDGDIGRAVELAERATRLIDVEGVRPEEGEMFVRQVAIEALLAAGQRDRARDACRAAHETLDRRAAAVEDAEMRASLCGAVPAHARIVALARELGVAPAPSVAAA